MPTNFNVQIKQQRNSKYTGKMSQQNVQFDGDVQQFRYRTDLEDESLHTSKRRVLSLLKQLEREFEYLYLENQALQERIDGIPDKPDKETEKVDNLDLDTSTSKNVIKKLSVSSQKSKTAQKLKAQTSKIVKNFMNAYNCNLVKEFSGHSDGVWEVSVARIGVSAIGTASADHTACIWSLETSKCLLQYQGHNGSVNSIRFHPSKDLVLTSSGDCTAHIWQAALNLDSDRTATDDSIENEEFDEVPSLRTPIRELSGHNGTVAAAEWLIGGEQIITASWDRLAILYDVESGAAIQTFSGHDQELTYAATHPTQRLAVTSSKDTTFRLWDFREAVHSVSVFQGHMDSVTSAVFTKQDNVVSSSDDRTVKIWDLKNMRSPVATIRVDSAVNRLAVSSDGIIALPHDSRNVRLFDLSGQRLARLPRTRRRGHERMVSSAAWTDDSSHGVNLFTSGFDKRVLGWSISTKDQ